MSSNPKHAIVFGASGISGLHVVRELLEYPTRDTFQSVVGVSNRPMSREAARLPEDRRLQLVSGIDLTASPENVTSAIQISVPNADLITHAYFYGMLSY